MASWRSRFEEMTSSGSDEGRGRLSSVQGALAILSVIVILAVALWPDGRDAPDPENKVRNYQVRLCEGDLGRRGERNFSKLPLATDCNIAEIMLMESTFRLVYGNARHKMRGTDVGGELVSKSFAYNTPFPITWNGYSRTHGTFTANEQLKCSELGGKPRCTGVVKSATPGKESYYHRIQVE